MSRERIVPGLRYRDANAAIRWLERVLGFTQQAVFPGEGNTIAHAELKLGESVLMLGSATNASPYRDSLAVPAENGGRTTVTLYIVVADCRAAYDRAKAAGAEILVDYEEKEYGGSGFTCRDPEGYIWALGSYDPFAQPQS